MADDNPTPHLFAWGDEGLPGEFKIYLKSIGGDDGNSQVDFLRNGVVRVAEEFLRQLRNENQPFITNKEPSPKPSHKIRSMIYMLHTYCAQCKVPAPPELLRLTFEALDLQERHPGREIEQLLSNQSGGGIPVGIEKLSAFIKASALDGAADADSKVLNVSELARAVGVQRATVRAWRGMTEYKSRRKSVAWASSGGGNRKV